MNQQPRPHTPIRPLWLCRTDGQPWPCPTARLTLARRYTEQHTALLVHLGTCLIHAHHDLHALHPTDPPTPTQLSRRFLGWVNPPTADREVPRPPAVTGDPEAPPTTADDR